MNKLLIAIDVFDTSKKIDTNIFYQNKIDLSYNNTNQELSYHDNFDLYKDVDYIIAGLEKYDRNFFENFPNIKAISRIGVGTDNIDLAAAKQNGVKVFKTSDKPSVAVAELCISNIISLLRNTYTMSNNLKIGNWTQLVGREIKI